MPWAVCVKRLSDQRFMLFPEGVTLDVDESEYDQDVHIVPCRKTDTEYHFGVHDLTRDCICKPRVDVNINRKTLVLHREDVN